MSQNNSSISWVRTESAPTLPPPVATVGVVGWIRTNLFNGIANSVLTVILSFLVIYFGWQLLGWTVFHAVFVGVDKEACIDAGHGGACWIFIFRRFNQLMYGFYDKAEQWRVNIAGIILFAGIIWLAIPDLPYKKPIGIFMGLFFPVIAAALFLGGERDMSLVLRGVIMMAAGFGAMFYANRQMNWIGNLAPLFGLIGIIGFVTIFIGGNILDLKVVPPNKWGGFFLTLVIATVGIVLSLPIGIALALGRRSDDLPVIKWFCILFIEFWRGVPLVAVLFMSAFVLKNLFPPSLKDINVLWFVLIGVTCFASAYMAEVVRGGLQALPSGQYEAADAMGLVYWQKMRLIILPQALTIVIPGIVNTFIGLFKDTTLVAILGMLDLLGIATAGRADPKWAAPSVAMTSYIFVAMWFFVFCYAMSRYSVFVENRVNKSKLR